MHVTLKLTGRSALVQHNPQLLDPMNPITREIAKLTWKRKKTDADYDEIAHLEFLGGLYHDDTLGVYVPTNGVARCLERAARSRGTRPSTARSQSRPTACRSSTTARRSPRSSGSARSFAG